MDTLQRRRFSRIRFCNAATFQIDCDQWSCDVLDLSLQGALVAVDHLNGDIADRVACLLELRLDDEVCVRMEGRVAHHDGTLVGIVCDETDLDSMSHLRRLLALNLGDASMLEREFSALFAAHQAN